MIDESGACLLRLEANELVALYMVLIRHEGELDQRQLGVLESVAAQVYAILSVDEIEHIESYYHSL